MKKVLKTIIGLLLLCILGCLLCIVVSISYSEIKGADSKEYIIENYDYNDWNILAIKTTEYVYEEEADCGTLWIRKCTNDSNLYKSVVLIDKNGKKIKVFEYKDKTFKVSFEE